MTQTHRTRPALALLAGALLALSGLPGAQPARAVAAAGSLRLDPPSPTADVGDSVTVKVVTTANVDLSGAQATVTFDKTKLQVTSLTRLAPWSGAPLQLGGDVAAANASGTLKTVASSFLPPTSVPAGDADFVAVTFKAIACGDVEIGLPVGPADAALLDASSADVPVTSTGATVSIPCPVVPPSAATQSLPAWLSTNAVPVGWSGIAGSAPIASYDVRYRRAPWNGTYGSYALWRSATATTSATFTTSPGYTYCFSALARDINGVVSTWSAERCTAAPLDDRSLSRSGSWSVGSSSSFYRSTYVRSTSTSAKLTRTGVQAKRIAVMVTTCKTCGSVKVYWGSTLLKTISLYSATTVRKKLITVVSWTSVRSGTLSFKPGRSGKSTYIDGVAISRY